MRLACNKEDYQEEDTDQSAALAAVGCLETINTVLQTVKSQGALFPQLCHILMPLYTRVLAVNDAMIMGTEFEVYCLSFQISWRTYYAKLLLLRTALANSLTKCGSFSI